MLLTFVLLAQIYLDVNNVDVNKCWDIYTLGVMDYLLNSRRNYQYHFTGILVYFPI